MKKKLWIICIALMLSVISVMAYEKAELINGDMVVIQRISNMAEPFAISLGSNEFASNQPMTIEILISVPTDRSVVTAEAKIVNSKGELYNSWRYSNTVPASGFSWYIKQSTTAPPLPGTYIFSYEARDSRTGGIAVSESKQFTVSLSGAQLNCPVDSCKPWTEVQKIENGKLMQRECSSFNRDGLNCVEKVINQNQIICAAGYYISGTSCISESADSDGNGIIDKDDQGSVSGQENPITDFLSDLGLIDPTVIDNDDISGTLVDSIRPGAVVT